ncbi:MAG: protein kinase [Flavobacteriales bacterium]|nr:protein kinase [Flavobacteriales bacterium]NCQ13358.1 protein kinase [Flavobacteriales bacterium]NCQ58885.1 protein kinase [Flavobacteriales bacterium]NCT16483.1 protein kinase [Flavobacteriales bacterium]
MRDNAVNPIIRDFIRTQNDIEIDRYSDKGGFGELYFGKRKIFDDRVALKFYVLDENGDGHEEPILLKEITHENILPLIDARIIDDRIAFYLTPEISGGDLQNIIDNYTLSTDKSISIIQGVLKGLTELHKPPLNLVHRDLKTYNILIDKNDGKSYLADFGTIKKIPEGQDYVSASKYTFLYRPPEVILENRYTKQSDIYQMGVILYQTLGGHFPMKKPDEWLIGRKLLKFQQLQPFEQQTYLANHLEELIVKGKLINLDTLPIYISKKLKTIIRTATNPDIGKRYTTCADFLKALFDYQKTSKDWWTDIDTIHAYNKKSKREYRIIKRKKELVTEWRNDKTDWRKDFSDNKLQKHIDNIEGK